MVEMDSLYSWTKEVKLGASALRAWYANHALGGVVELGGAVIATPDIAEKGYFGKRYTETQMNSVIEPLT